MLVSATIIVERDEEEIELTIEGEFTPGLSGSPSDYPEGSEDIEIEDIYQDGESWEGELTEEEEILAHKALVTMVRSQDYSFEEDEDEDSFSIRDELDFEDD
jgi:hypothetical protein